MLKTPVTTALINNVINAFQLQVGIQIDPIDQPDNHNITDSP